MGNKIPLKDPIMSAEIDSENKTASPNWSQKAIMNEIRGMVKIVTVDTIGNLSDSETPGAMIVAKIKTVADLLTITTVKWVVVQNAADACSVGMMMIKDMLQSTRECLSRLESKKKMIDGRSTKLSKNGPSECPARSVILNQWLLMRKRRVTQNGSTTSTWLTMNIRKEMKDRGVSRLHATADEHFQICIDKWIN